MPAALFIQYTNPLSQTRSSPHAEEEEEEEEDFVFNNTIEGPRAPAVKPGRITQAYESEGCSPVSGGRTIRLCSLRPPDDLPTPLRPPVDTGAGDRGGASAKFSGREGGR